MMNQLSEGLADLINQLPDDLGQDISAEIAQLENLFKTGDIDAVEKAILRLLAKVMTLQNSNPRPKNE